MVNAKGKLVLVVIVICTVPIALATKCSQRVSKHKEWVNNAMNPTEYLYTRYNHFMEFQCCVDGPQNVVWYRKDPHTGSWQTLDAKTNLDDRFVIYDEGQAFAIKFATAADEGLYKCSLGKDSDTEKHFSLTVEGCDVLERGPYPTLPMACRDTLTTSTETLTLPCTGYFGCGDDDMRIVQWYVSPNVGPESDKWTEVDEFDSQGRYSVKTFKRGSAVLGANLTITDVKAVDFDRKFMCVLASPQIIQGQTNLVVRLQEKGSVETENIPLLDGSVGVIVMIISVGVLVALVVMVTVICICIKRSQKKQHPINKSTVRLHSIPEKNCNYVRPSEV